MYMPQTAFLAHVWFVHLSTLFLVQTKFGPASVLKISGNLQIETNLGNLGNFLNYCIFGQSLHLKHTHHIGIFDEL